MYRKIKLTLIQPEIICSGRKRISCFYKGFVIEEDSFLMKIKIKSKKEDIILTFDKERKTFLESEWKDLQILDN